MKIEPIFEKEFFHDGRGPELIRALWKSDGKVLWGFEYINPTYEGDVDIKHIELITVQAYSMAWEEVHGNIQFANGSKAAIIRIEDSPWLKQLLDWHLSKCGHYQIVFYDEIYDVICEDIRIGDGQLK